MKFSLWNLSVLLMIFITIACVEPYEPKVDSTDINLLVVDGFLNASDGVATVTLTRTEPVPSIETNAYEFGALVSIEDDRGLLYPLAETGSGQYSGTVANISFENQYRLLITTRSDSQYSSEFISLMKTPPIDSIGYGLSRDGLQVTVSTHDNTNRSHYYRWTFTETFEYHANFSSLFKFTGIGVVEYRLPRELNFKCWRTDVSTGIVVGTTARLKEAVVNQFPVTVIPVGSLKISRKYSILLRQQTLSAEAYEYWSNLQKSTESLGGLFDPLPSEVSGNIHGITNPEHHVIGFFSGGTVQEKRSFITREELPERMLFNYRNPNCVADTLLNASLENVSPSTFLIDAIYSFGSVIGYTTSDRSCIDCTYFGGTTQRPDFWE